jgi:hypothetical protein
MPKAGPVISKFENPIKKEETVIPSPRIGTNH